MLVRLFGNKQCNAIRKVGVNNTTDEKQQMTCVAMETLFQKRVPQERGTTFQRAEAREKIELVPYLFRVK